MEKYMTVRAKFSVTSVELFTFPKGARSIKLGAVYKSKPNNEAGNAVDENLIFGQATPSGSIQMMIHNPPAAEFFEIGEEYYVDFTKAPSLPKTLTES